MNNKANNNLGFKTQENEGFFSPLLRKCRYFKAKQFIKSDSVVLDVGCGQGSFKKCLKNCDYYGINLFKAWMGKQNNLYVGDVMESIPVDLQIKKFDYVCALAVIEHIKEPEKFIIILRKLLKPDGKIILTTPHPIGRKIHDFGSKIGFFSKDASEEHEQFIDLKLMNILLKSSGLKIAFYKRFLFGFNQIFVIK